MIDIDVRYPMWKPYRAQFERLQPRQAVQLLRSVAKRVDSATVSSVARVLKSSGYTISRSAVKKHAFITTKINSASVTIRIKGKRVPAVAFKTKPSKFANTTGSRRMPTDVMFKKQLGWHGIKNGFMWESPEGAQLMFERTTKKRKPIQEVSFMPIPMMIADDETARDAIMNDVFDTMVKRFEYELNRRWGR